MTCKAYKRLNLLRHLSSLFKTPSPNTMIHLYNTLIRPIFEYGSICIINAAECHMNKLQLLQNQALRVVTKNPMYISIKDLHDITGTQPIKTHLISDARRRLGKMRKNTRIVDQVIQEYNLVKNIHENQSPLDILTNN